MAAEMSFGGMLGLGAASSAAGGLINQAFAGVNARRQWKYQQKQMALQQQYALEQMQKQQDYQKEMFDYQNAYNDPSAVLKRYLAAGLNPSAAFGSSGSNIQGTVPGGSGAGTAGLPSPGTVPSGAPSSSPLSEGLAVAQMRALTAQADKDDSQANLNDKMIVTQGELSSLYAAQGKESLAREGLLSMQSAVESIKLSFWGKKGDEYIDGLLNNLKASTEKLTQEAGLTEAQIPTARIGTINAVLDGLLTVQNIENAGQQGELLKAQTLMVNNQARYISFQAEDLQNNIKSLAASNQLTLWTGKYDKDGERIMETVNLSGYDARAMSIHLGALVGAREAVVRDIDSNWARTDHWTSTITSYLGTILSLGSTAIAGGRAVTAAKVGKAYTQSVANQSAPRTTEYYDGAGTFVGGRVDYR